MPLFAATVFLSAFLLFQVQPMMGKIILPWFGGTPAVWTTCMLFFQVALLAGYAWSHLLASRLRPRPQLVLHLCLLALAALAVAAGWVAWGSPLVPGPGLKPPDSSHPILRIVLLLLLSVGLPYFALSTTGPLLQSWTARSFPEKTAYRLYALSNAGSLLGLVAYPFVIEPALRLKHQALVWAAGFALFAALCTRVAMKAAHLAPAERPVAEPASARPSAGTVGLWLGLPASASVLLLAVTNQLTQEVAPVPFLWVLPLVVYLLSFILTFESDRWYTRARFIPAFMVIALWLALQSFRDLEPPVPWQVATYTLLLFFGCMVMHGEMARLRPPARHLTHFYLALSSGGAMGGIFVGVIAPAIFPAYWELHVGIAACWVGLLAALIRDKGSALHGPYRAAARGAVGFSFLATILLLWMQAVLGLSVALDSRRDFYGAMKVRETDTDTPALQTRWLYHGRIVHGAQHLADDKRRIPNMYFSSRSGVGIALANYPRPADPGGQEARLRIGIVGLGVGTLAGWAHQGDVVRYYEISPEVIKVAEGDKGYFTWLSDSKGKVEVVEGDARTSLERELATTGPQRFDVLILDAFSSDSIPVHLVTLEAMKLYLAHLKGPQSLIVVQASNRYVRLQPVIFRLAQELGLKVGWIDSNDYLDIAEGPNPRIMPSDWLLVTRDGSLLDQPAIARALRAPPSQRVSLWTDDHAALFEVVNLR